MKVVGYTDRLSVAAGETIHFMVSCELPTYRADIVRLIHGDPNPRGPGFKEELITSTVSGEHQGQFQEIYTGSYVRVADSPRLRVRGSFTLQAWIFSTTPQKGQQGIVTKWCDTQSYGLFIDEHGELALWLGGAQSQSVRIRSGKSLRAAEWYFIAATYDAQSGTVHLYQQPLREWPQDGSHTIIEHQTSIHELSDNKLDLLIAAYWQRSQNGQSVATGHFNGKIDSPRLFGRALSREEILSLKRGASPLAFDSALISAWDFSRDISSRKVTDISPHKLHGETVNMPARAMTGYNWTGRETNFHHASQSMGLFIFMMMILMMLAGRLISL